jgi:hypothetical protein
MQEVYEQPAWPLATRSDIGPPRNPLGCSLHEPPGSPLGLLTSFSSGRLGSARSALRPRGLGLARPGFPGKSMSSHA